MTEYRNIKISAEAHRMLRTAKGMLDADMADIASYVIYEWFRKEFPLTLGIVTQMRTEDFDTIEDKVAEARSARKKAAEAYELTNEFWQGREDFTKELAKKGPRKPKSRTGGGRRRPPAKEEPNGTLE